MSISKSISQGLIVVLLFACGCGSDITTKHKALDNPRYTDEVETRIDNVINNLQVQTALEGMFDSSKLSDQMDYYHTPGVSIAVINDYRLEWARGFGVSDLTANDSVDTKTLFQAGSVSKPVFALGVMQLVQQGLLDLDRDVNDYLKSWKVPGSAHWKPKITLRQLLSHTAGLTVHGFPGYLRTEAIPTLPQLLDGAPPTNTAAVRVNLLPGTTFRYSGGGITVAQLALEDKTNETLPVIINRELFKPLQLKYSTYLQQLPEDLLEISSVGHPFKGKPIEGRSHVYPEMAAAGLWSNPTELSTMVIEMYKALKGESSLFEKETIEEMLTPQKVASFVGIGFFLQGSGDSTRFQHGGWDEGFVTQLTAYKNLGKGAIIMVNSNEGNPLLNEIMRSIALEYDWPDFIATRSEMEVPNREERAKYAGIYSSENNQFAIASAEDQLYLKYQDQDSIPLFKTPQGELSNPNLNFQIQVEDEALVFSQNGQTTSYQKKPDK